MRHEADDEDEYAALLENYGAQKLLLKEKETTCEKEKCCGDLIYLCFFVLFIAELPKGYSVLRIRFASSINFRDEVFSRIKKRAHQILILKSYRDYHSKMYSLQIDIRWSPFFCVQKNISLFFMRCFNISWQEYNLIVWDIVSIIMYSTIRHDNAHIKMVVVSHFPLRNKYFLYCHDYTYIMGYLPPFFGINSIYISTAKLAHIVARKCQ